MAKQAGFLLLTGTIGNLTFYEMGGKYYVKRKTEISGKKIRTNPQYSNTLRNANWFGLAVKLAKKVYWELPRSERDQYKTWYPMRNRAQELVRRHLEPDEILRILQEEWLVPKVVVAPVVEIPEPVVFPSYPDLPLRKMYGVAESELIDQLVASTAFVRSILRAKIKTWKIRGMEDKNGT